MSQQTEIITKLIAHITGECTKIDTEKAYDDMLDECYSFECVGGIFAHLSPAKVLAEFDPTAYRCGKNDYEDSQRDVWTEIESDYYDTDDVDKAKEEFIDGLNNELAELETEKDDAEADDDHDVAELKRITDAIAQKEFDIAECEKHSF